MYTPTLEEVRRLSDQGNMIPVSREIEVNAETPISVYLKVARAPYSFLLESVEGGERIARYSFIGTEPSSVIKTGSGQEHESVDPLGLVQEALSQSKVIPIPNIPRFVGGAVGYISYDAVKYFEKLPSFKTDNLGLPESVFMIATTFLVFDHLRKRITVVSHADLNGDVESGYKDAVSRIDELVQRLDGPFQDPDQQLISKDHHTVPSSVASNMPRKEYEEMVNKVKDYVVAGDVIQTVVSQRFSRPVRANPLDVYRSLRNVNPSPYMFLLELGDFHLVGASPEMLVRCVGGNIDYHPIAGTLPRGSNKEEDTLFENRLKNDEKERAEHIMLVDLGRNDVGRVSEPGSVKVTELMEIERYSHVMHLVSHITGKLKSEYTNYDLLRACFPAGTVAGAPKVRAMEIIAELETDARGPYAGAVGYFDLMGNMDTAIAIRTMVLKDGMAYVQAGGGIVYDSKPESEYQETVHKASAVLRAIEIAEGI